MRRSRFKVLQLLVLFLAVAVPVSLVAQDYPPNGPKIPPILLTGGGEYPPEEPPPPGPREENSAWNTELVGHNDLQGRSAYQPIIINQDGRHILYMGHHDRDPLLNPLTGQMERNGVSIVDVSDPGNTEYLAHIPTNDEPRQGGSQMVQVCSGSVLPNGVDGKWYLLRPLGGFAHEIWDVSDPSSPSFLTTIVENLTGTHKNWWECDTGIAYLVANNREEGWTGGNHLKIYDLSDPANPRYIRDFGILGSQPGATNHIGREGGTGIHGPISAGPEKNRVYVAYGTGNNGIIQILDRQKLLNDFENPLNPTEEELLAPQLGYIVMSPDQGAHTTFPIFDMPIPGFQGHQILQKRDILMVSSEAGRSDNCGANYPPEENNRPAPHLAWLVDISQEATPWPLSTMRVQETHGDYCGRGGRHGVHSSTESFYPPYYGKIAIIAYFNAGVWVWDIRDPFKVHEVAYFIPAPNEFSVPQCSNSNTEEGGEFGTQTPDTICRKMGVTNNVEVDDRGLIYTADRPGGGVHIVQLTGYAKQIVDSPAVSSN